jgi:excisionase family DNA binding protein
MPFKHLTLEEAAELLQCPIPFLRSQAVQGGLPHITQGDKILFNQEELLNWSSLHLMDANKDRKKRSVLSKAAEAEQRILPSHFCHLDWICLDLPGKTKAAVLANLTKLAEKTGYLFDSKEFNDSLCSREQQASTALPGGVALVHPASRDEYLFEESFVCIAKSTQSIFFGEENGGSTDLFFLIACKDEEHLPVLGCLGKMIMKTTLLEELRDAESPKEILTILQATEKNMHCPRK